MKDDITVFVGLDVHKDSVAIAVAEDGRSEPRFVGTCGPELRELLKALAHLGNPAHTLIAYEAGPSGFALARQLAQHGWHCQVIAVSKTPRKPGERIKTDRRDALALARYLRSGDLTPVVIPDAQDEAIRDLSRARQDAVRARLKVRQQLKAMLLRHGKRFPGKTSWGASHERYLARIGFDHPAQQIAFAEYRAAVMEAHERVERLTAALREQLQHWRYGPAVKALMCFKGIDFVAAATIVCELGDMHRFEHPKQLMAYLGLVPSRVLQRHRAHPGQHHQDRQHPCAAHPGRVGLVLSLLRAPEPPGSPTPARAAQGRSRHRLAGAASPVLALSALVRPRHALQQDLRGRGA